MVELRCPRCGSSNAVKNGIVRSVQRYCCRACKYNFSNDFKHRWAPSSKLINLLLLRSGEDLKGVAKGAGASPQTVDRWLLEAKDRHPWFVRALAEQLLFEVRIGEKPFMAALEDSAGDYAFVTGDRREDGVASFLWNLLRDVQTLLDGTQALPVGEVERLQDLLSRVEDAVRRDLGDSVDASRDHPSSHGGQIGLPANKLISGVPKSD